MRGTPRLADALARVHALLDSRTIHHAVVGAVAVGVRTEPRFTSDIDLAVSVESDADAERVVHDMVQGGYSVLELFQTTKTEEIVTVRFLHRELPEIVTDLLFQTSGIEREVVSTAEQIEVFPGHWIGVARVGHLISMKLLSRGDERPQDQTDLVKLVGVASATTFGSPARVSG